MAGAIIEIVVCVLYAASYIGVALLYSHNGMPIPFWSGSEEKLHIKDLPAYNKHMKRLYLIYGIIILCMIPVVLFNAETGIFGLFLTVFPGVIIVWAIYKHYLKTYSVSPAV